MEKYEAISPSGTWYMTLPKGSNISLSKSNLWKFIHQDPLDEIASYFAILDRWSVLYIVKVSCWYTQNYPLFPPSKSTKKQKKDTNMWNRSLARIDVPPPQITVESCFMAHFLAFVMVHVTRKLKMDNLSFFSLKI